MKRSRPRTATELSRSTNRRLEMYAIAAGAAGIGVLALAQPAEAEIIYTKTHQVIGERGVYNLDLNGTGTTEFTISNEVRRPTSAYIQSLLVLPAAGNSVAVGTRGFSAAAMVKGQRIGGARKFGGNALMAVHCSGFTSCGNGTGGTFTSGPWVNVTNRYLGLRFKISGKTHYGWARLSVQVSQSPFAVTATLTGYAYESTNNTSIIAGKTTGPDVITIEAPSLGNLAAGASRIPVRRLAPPTR